MAVLPRWEIPEALCGTRSPSRPAQTSAQVRLLAELLEGLVDLRRLHEDSPGETSPVIFNHGADGPDINTKDTPGNPLLLRVERIPKSKFIPDFGSVLFVQDA